MAKSKKNATAKSNHESPAEDHSAKARRRLRRADAPSPRTKVSRKEGRAKQEPDQAEEVDDSARLMRALGTEDLSFVRGLVSQLASVSAQGGEIDAPGLASMVSAIKGVKPRDEVEAMLAAQMAAVHMATMTFARRLAQVENIPQQDSAERAFNKLARTFTTQIEALKRYRTGGEQKVTVQYVSVSEGGQAVVGNVTQTPREKAAEKAAPAALPHPQDEPMPMLNKSRKRVISRRRRKT